MMQVELQPFTDGDATATVTVVPKPAPTRTIAELADEVGWLGDRTGLLVQDADQLHSETRQLHTDTLDELLRTEAATLATKPVVDLITTLADAGFAWRDIARLVGVSVPALRKWRHGESATGENRLRAARLVALCGLLAEKAIIADPASWLEVPLVEDVPICGLDLLIARREDLVLRRALDQQIDPESILDDYEPDWRSTYRGAFEVFEADDGFLGLRAQDSDGE